MSVLWKILRVADLLSDIKNAKMPNGSQVKLEFDADKALFLAYCIHHVATAGAYLWSLETHSLSALLCLGLVFETPVIFLNIREFVVIFDKDMGGIIKNKIERRNFCPQRGILFSSSVVTMQR